MYIIYDTQLIVEDSENGNRDVPTHSMILFMDLLDLFLKIVKVLIALLEDSIKK